LSEEDVNNEKKKSTRLCGFLEQLMEHAESVKRFPGNNAGVCVVCGGNTAKVCSKCNKAMHMDAPKDSDTTASCFLCHHNTGFFGLGRDDCRIVKRKRSSWTFPTAGDRQVNAAQMKVMHKRLADDAENRDHGTPSSSNTS